MNANVLAGLAYTIANKPAVWVVSERFEGGVLAVCSTKRGAYLFRMRHRYEEVQSRRDDTLMYGRGCSRDEYRRMYDDHDGPFFLPNVWEAVVEVHEPPPHPTKPCAIL